MRIKGKKKKEEGGWENADILLACPLPKNRFGKEGRKKGERRKSREMSSFLPYHTYSEREST